MYVRLARKRQKNGNGKYKGNKKNHEKRSGIARSVWCFIFSFRGTLRFSRRCSICFPVFLSFHTLRSSADRLFIRSKFNEIPSLNGTSEYLLFRISCKQRGFLNTFSLPPFGVFLSPRFRIKRSARFLFRFCRYLKILSSRRYFIFLEAARLLIYFVDPAAG